MLASLSSTRLPARCLLHLVAVLLIGWSQLCCAAPNLALFKNLIKQNKVKVGVIYQGNPLYSTFTSRNYQSRYAFKKPLAIGLPTDAKQVGVLLSAASRAGLPVAIRGGGHNYEALSSIDKGLVIDMSKFDHISINLKARTVTVGAGQRLGPIYRDLWLKAKSILPGGTCVGVGVAGLTLGGGIGVNLRKLGPLADHLLSAQLVLANGKVMTVSSSSYPDLYFAIRGGGGNYGVLTSLTFRFTKAPAVVTVLDVWYPSDKFPAVMAAIAKWKPYKMGPNYSKVEWMYTSNGVSVQVFYWGRKAAVEGLVKAAPPFKVPGMAVKQLHEMAYKDFLLMSTNLDNSKGWSMDKLTMKSVLDAAYGPNAKASTKPKPFKAGSILLDKDLSPSAVDAFLKQMKANPKAWVQTRAFGAQNAAPKVGAAAYPHRHTLWEIQVFSDWASSSDTQWVGNVRAALKPYSSSTQYLNYVDCNNPPAKVWEIYFGPNAGRLKSIKAQYDPKNMFNALTCR